MAGVALRPQFGHAQLGGDALKDFSLGGEETELSLLSGLRRRVGILDDGRQGGVGHGESALTPSVELVRERAETVGVALEVDEVVPLLRGEVVAQFHASPLAEVGTDGALAGVPEWRISQVVGQASGGHNLAHAAQGVEPGLCGMPFAQQQLYLASQRTAHARHLQAVGEAVVDENAARERKHLCLVLQATEWRGKNQSVIVALKIAAHAALLGIVVVFEP